MAFAPGLSLLEQGISIGPSAPLLLVNGTQDSVFPIQDMHLLMEHGNPKSARWYAHEGHMGSPEAIGVIVDWLRTHLSG